MLNGQSLIGTTDNTGFFSLFSWNGSQFVPYQKLPLSNPQELCFLNISDTTYIAVWPSV